LPEYDKEDLDDFIDKDKNTIWEDDSPLEEEGNYTSLFNTPALGPNNLLSNSINLEVINNTFDKSRKLKSPRPSPK
jgi:hypothetical protein